MQSTSYPKKMGSTSYLYKKQSMQVSAVCVPKLAGVGMTTDVKKKSMAEASGPVYACRQKPITLPEYGRGCYRLTSVIKDQIKEELSGFKWGLAHFFLQDTGVSLTIIEKDNPDVVGRDIEAFLNRIVTEGSSASRRHTGQRPDGMPAHIKSSMFGCALTIPITDGKLNMGEQQGIWLCQHRKEPISARVVITLNGMRR